MLFGRQVFYCNNCGARCWRRVTSMLGGTFLGGLVCSAECSTEFQLKRARSVMGEDCLDPALPSPEERE